MDETSYPGDQGYSDHSIASKSADDADDDPTQDDLASVHDQNTTLLKNRKEGRVYCNCAISSGLLCNEECASVGGLKHHLNSARHIDEDTHVEMDIIIATHNSELKRIRKHNMMYCDYKLPGNLMYCNREYPTINGQSKHRKLHQSADILPLQCDIPLPDGSACRYFGARIDQYIRH